MLRIAIENGWKYIENTIAMERVKICLHHNMGVWVWDLSLRQNHSSVKPEPPPQTVV